MLRVSIGGQQAPAKPAPVVGTSLMAAHQPSSPFGGDINYAVAIFLFFTLVFMLRLHVELSKSKITRL